MSHHQDKRETKREHDRQAKHTHNAVQHHEKKMILRERERERERRKEREGKR